MRNISCKPYYIQDAFGNIPHCNDSERIEDINKSLKVDNTFSHFKSIRKKPCHNFALTYQQKISDTEIKNDTKIIDGKNETVYSFLSNFWFIFSSDEIKIVTQEQAYPLKSFIAEIGGYIGMFLGISFMQVIIPKENFPSFNEILPDSTTHK